MPLPPLTAAQTPIVVIAQLESGVAIASARNTRDAFQFVARYRTHERLSRVEYVNHIRANEIVERLRSYLPSPEGENVPFRVTWDEARALVRECSALFPPQTTKSEKR